MTKKRIVAGFFCALIALVGVTRIIGAQEEGFPPALLLTLLFAGLTYLCFRRGKKQVAPYKQDTNDKAAVPRLVFAASMVGANSSDPDAAALYKQIFYSHMGTLGGFTQQDVDRIYSMLAGTGERIGGNAVRYSSEAVLEAEFADREWVWPEMDEWERIFRQEGNFPGSWDYWWNAPDLENMDMPTLCNMLTVGQIREVLDSLAVSYPAKSKKADLVALLGERAGIQDIAQAMPEWEEKSLERKRERSKARGRELFRLISSRTGSRNTAQLLVANGKKTSLVIDSPSDEVYIKKTLVLNPDAVPPFFPGDRSRY